MQVSQASAQLAEPQHSLLKILCNVSHSRRTGVHELILSKFMCLSYFLLTGVLSNPYSKNIESNTAKLLNKSLMFSICNFLFYDTVFCKIIVILTSLKGKFYLINLVNHPSSDQIPFSLFYSTSSHKQ